MSRYLITLLMLSILVGCSSTGMTEQDIKNQITLYKGYAEALKESGVKNVNLALQAKTKAGGGYWKVGLELDPPFEANILVTTVVNP